MKKLRKFHYWAKNNFLIKRTCIPGSALDNLCSQNISASLHASTEAHRNCLCSFTRFFFIRTQFISNLVLGILKFKRLLELQKLGKFQYLAKNIFLENNVYLVVQLAAHNKA